jgi:ABC-type branched-subunit amino acid transport system ATPase component
MNHTILSVEELHQHYGSLVAVNNFSAKIYVGELVGLLDPNGAGKSTTLRIRF